MENGIFNELLDAFMKYRGCGFVSLKYRSKDGELSRRLLNVGAKFDNAQKSDLELIANGIPYVASETGKYTKIDWDLALAEKKQSLIKPDENRSLGQINAYVVLNEDNGSVKYNMNTEEIYLFAKNEKKEVLEAGNYKVVKSRAKTIAKKVIEKSLKSSQFRTFLLKNLAGTVKINKQVINIDGEDREELVIEVEYRD